MKLDIPSYVQNSNGIIINLYLIQTDKTKSLVPKRKIAFSLILREKRKSLYVMLLAIVSAHRVSLCVAEAGLKLRMEPRLASTATLPLPPQG